ncbi:MAG: DUF3237 domain-containing protein [Sphingomonadales bacterium]|jgi:hypothetical protein|nr:DUF3237 domain-containing protein [Sphingomonadales bacterium]
MTPFGETAEFRLDVWVEAPVALDAQTNGPVRLVRISGGTISGALTGVILPGGTDWQSIRPDGTTEIEARYLLELSDGARVELQSRGLRAHGASGFWSSIWLRTPDSRHAALNDAQFLGKGRKEPQGVIIELFRLPAL